MSDRHAAGPMSRETAWLVPVILPVVFAGAAVATAGLVFLARDPPGFTILGGLFALFAAAAFVEAFPIPIEADHAQESETSLANVFIVGTAVIYGWESAAVVGFATMLLIECLRRRQQPARAGFNSALYALAGAAAGLTASVFSDDRLASLLAAAGLGSVAFYVVNIGLLAVVIARTGRERYVAVLRRYLMWTALPFLIMASVTLMLAVLWERSPFLAAALAGPLIAIALYQRSVHRAVEAMRLASTDPLTGLGNHGSFHTRLEAALEEAEPDAEPTGLVLIDLDDFKHVNDSFGHPMGDRVLAQLARELRRSEDAFRVGGDEFAIVLPGVEEPEALAIAKGLVARLSDTEFEHGGTLTVSAGVAVAPRHATDRARLVAAADRALYDAKEIAKGTARAYTPALLEISELKRLAALPDREARLRAAASLAFAVDARDAYTGSHSHSVGDLAGRIAAQLGLPPDEVELVRLAGRLHDLGKLAIPEEILRKPGPLDPAERLVLERHAQIGHRMLRSLGVEPVATWVRHHHERWDGGGYPDGLAGAEIPLGSRIVFVADALDAMTTERVYGERRTQEEALREAARAAGSQFDPEVVAALQAILAPQAAAHAGSR